MATKKEKDANIKQFYNTRKAAIDSLFRINTYLKDYDVDSKDLFSLQVRLDKLGIIEKKFESAQTELDTLQSAVDHSVTIDNFENMFFSTQAGLMTHIQAIEGDNKATQRCETTDKSVFTQLPSNSSLLQLARLKMPEFDGKYCDWLSFRDMFRSLVHEDSTIPVIYKFHQLKSHLKGEPAELIQSIEVTIDNYPKVWNLLCSRFDNNKRIIQSHVSEIFNLPKIEFSNAKSLRNFTMTLNKNLRALSSLGQPTDKWDSLIIFIACAKLDKSTLRAWEEHSVIYSPDDFDYSVLEEFLSNRCTSLEAYESQCGSTDHPSGKSTNNSKVGSRDQKFKQNHINFNSNCMLNNLSESPRCFYCKGSHPIFYCSELKAKPVPERWTIISDLKLCKNCFSSQHSDVEQCPSKSSCRVCSVRHNSMLHFDNPSGAFHGQGQAPVSPPTQSGSAFLNVGSSVFSTFVNKAIDQPSPPSPSSSTLTFTKKSVRQVILPTAVVTIFDSTNKPHNLRLILDSGSQLNLITKRMADCLGLKIFSGGTIINGINSAHTSSTNFITATISSRLDSFNASVDFHIIPAITTTHFPSKSFQLDSIVIPNNIHASLADPNFNCSAPLDGLLGAQTFFDVLFNCGHEFFKHGELYFCKSKLGWIASGSILVNIPRPRHCFMAIFDDQLNNNSPVLDEFEPDEHDKRPSKDHQFCEKHFQETVHRNEEGKFVVSLPFKKDPSELGDSLINAKQSFFSLERRFQRNPFLKEQYSAFMREYSELNQMAIIPSNEISKKPHFYLPHHPVFKNSSTSNIRVVFNASWKTTSGNSLNDVLCTTQPVQSSLYSIILRFRMYKYVITGDVAKMYRQILVRREDQDFQRIVWRENPQDELQHFRLLTVTYGESPAPFLATRCLQQLAYEIEHSNPSISDIIKHDFYIDDLLTGSDELDEVMYIQRNVSSVLSEGGMQLRKWCSNDRRVLDSITPDEDPHHVVRFSDDKESVNTLGLCWNPSQDVLGFRLTDTFRQTHLTKRSILSDLAKIFDPLGLITPVLIKGKIFVQDLWQNCKGWDEVLPEPLQDKWVNFSKNLLLLNYLEVDRQACFNSARFELHGFSDASQSAYGACVYIKSWDEFNEPHINLLTSKSRVAPVKTISIPRLELCAAVLLVRLVSSVTASLKGNPKAIHFWTDSQIVLAWLSGEPFQFKTFIANRVTEIQHHSTRSQWDYVSTHSNPADLVSRGAEPEEIVKSSLWWSGPSWLNLEPSCWPSIPNNEFEGSDVLERKPIKYTLLNVSSSSLPHILIERYSSWNKLIGVTAYVLRYLHNLRNKAKRLDDGEPVPSLTVKERRDASFFLIKHVQNEEFASEIKILREGKVLPNKNRLLQLSPFIQMETGLLRVGGRLGASNFSFNKKYPILLPSKHELTFTLLRYYHESHLHIGAQSLLAIMRNVYWPLNGKNCARMVIHRCVICYKAKPRAHEQMMAELPKVRVTPGRPFSCTGIDLCGPVFLTHGLRKRVKSKAYIAVFVCLVTRAIHLELVSSLSSSAFLAAFRRFVSRRGLCSNVYTDNGTNFTGANRELKRLFGSVKDRSDIHSYASKNEIVWHFNPPNAPHFGGIWEAAVKSTKHHLVRSVGNASLNFEEMSTFLCQIEACLNSRPLYPCSSDPNDCSALTPAHFLVGGLLTLPPDEDFAKIPSNRLHRWEFVQARFQEFWRKWSNEFINSQQQRPKWLKPKPNLSIGDLVLIRDPDLPPLRWKLARISELCPGRDNLVRVAVVKMSDGSHLKRPVERLCPLPLENPHEDSYSCS